MGQVLCPILIGRDHEMRALEGALTNALAGHGGCVVIMGEPGIGKSRLVREFTGRAGATGVAVVTGRAVPASINSPYRPVTEALLQLLRDHDLPSDPGMSPWLAALTAIVPGVIEASSGARDARAAVPAAIRGEAVLHLLRRAAPSGLLVVLEDLHWADPDTIALLEYLGDNLARERVLCVVTLRTEPSAALDLARRQRGRPGIVQVDLRPLDPHHAAAMVSACAVPVSPEHLAWVQQTADGVPLLIEDLLASRGLPETIAESVRQRLAELPGEQRAVLESAAVMGRHFDWELLSEATGEAPSVVAATLARAVDRLLVVADGDGFGFRHALTREAVLAAMLPPRHRIAAASALAALDAAHPRLDGVWRDVAADLAARAGDRTRAGRLLIDSGRDSIRVGALATALDTLRRAADLLEGDDRRSEAELLQIEALSVAGRVDEAAAVGNAVAGRLGADPRGRPTRIEVHLRLAQAAVAAARWRMARHQLDLAERLTGEWSPAMTARMAVLSADVALAEGDPDRARGLAEGVLDLPGIAPDLRCHALEIVGRSHRLHDLDAAQTAFEEALAIAEGAQLAVWRLRALHELGTIDMFAHIGVERLHEARRIAEQIGAVSTVATLDLQLSACYTGRWDLDHCDHHARAAITVAERLGLDQVRAKALTMLAGTASMRADVSATDRFTVLAAGIDPDDPMLKALGMGNRGVALLLAGDDDAAMDPYLRGMAAFARLPNAEPASMRALWPLILAGGGDRRAPDEVDQARRLGVGAFRLNCGLIGYAEAVLVGRRGDRRQAEELAAAADAAFVNCEPWAVLGRYVAAPAARADRWGQPERWLDEAAELFPTLGLDILAARARQLLKAGQPNPWVGEGITDREADVLRLIGHGRANKEIAANLGVSPRTVEKHVESLLRKTAARTRVELALWARSISTT